jgi:hypothetical protein
LKTTIEYPVNQALASCYGQIKGFDPNEEFAAWQRSSRTVKYLSIALTVLLLFFSASVVTFSSVQGERSYSADTKVEGYLFLLTLPIGVSFLAVALVSFNFFEHWRAKRKAYKNMMRFAHDYAEFLVELSATDEEVRRWSEQKIKQACLAVLETERSKIEAMKTGRGKAPRLKELSEIYNRMVAIGIRFDSVEAYIRQVSLSIRSKPQTPKTTKTKVQPKTEKSAYEPAA